MPTKKYKLDLSREYGHQRAVILWSEQPAVRQRWPELALLHHIKNETIGDAAQIAIDKASGVKKGVPDLHLPVPRGGYHSLYIEMKRPGGKASEAQSWWLEHLTASGNCARVADGWENAVQLLEWYLQLEAPDGPEQP